MKPDTEWRSDMEYNFNSLYKAMFTEHWKLSLVMLTAIGMVIVMALMSQGVELASSVYHALAVIAFLINVKAISTLIRAKLLIHFAKKGHWQSKQIYLEWING